MGSDAGPVGGSLILGPGVLLPNRDARVRPFQAHTMVVYCGFFGTDTLAYAGRPPRPEVLYTHGMNWIEFLGYAASASVLVTFCMSTMLPLRIVAIASNILFATYGAFAHIYPVLVLHAILLPVNVTRLLQILRLVKGVKTAQRSELSVESLLPFMSRRSVKAGEVLIHKGDKADRMYYLFSGAMKIPELNKLIEPGAIFGEIGIFTRDQKRMATVVCVSDSDVYEISENKVKQLYYQNPSFGFAVLRLIISRLLEDINRLEQAPGDTGRDSVP